MASVTRRLKRALRWRKPDARKTLALDEGFRLCKRLEQAARDNNAPDPMHFLAYLHQMRRGYVREVDGPSKLMDLQAEIAAYEAREQNRLAEYRRSDGS
jgi:hypothetical protein